MADDGFEQATTKRGKKKKPTRSDGCGTGSPAPAPASWQGPAQASSVGRGAARLDASEQLFTPAQTLD